jgi:hypothetical protein
VAALHPHLLSQVTPFLIGNVSRCKVFQPPRNEEYDSSVDLEILVYAVVKLMVTNCSETQQDRAVRATYFPPQNTVYTTVKSWNGLGLKYSGADHLFRFNLLDPELPCWIDSAYIGSYSVISFSKLTVLPRAEAKGIT